MSYIDYAYYTNEYGGKDVSESDFKRLAEIASIVIDAIVYCEIDEAKDYMNYVKMAVAYEMDTISAFGGDSCAFGESDANIVSESLDGYSYQIGGGEKIAGSTISFLNGIPVSPIVLSLLSKAGLRQRWVHAYDGDDEDV